MKTQKKSGGVRSKWPFRSEIRTTADGGLDEPQRRVRDDDSETGGDDQRVEPMSSRYGLLKIAEGIVSSPK